MNLVWRGLAVSLIMCAVFAYGAAAQFSPFNMPNSDPPYPWTNDSGTSDDWGRCSHRDRQFPNPTLRSCTHIINERNGGQITAGAYYFRGLTYELLGDDAHAATEFENAYRWFTIAIGADRTNPEPRANRAAVLTHLGRFDEALADYDAALAVSDRAYSAAGTRVRPGVSDTTAEQIADYHLARGMVYFRRRDWTNAIAAFDRAATLAPRDGDAQLYRCEGRAAAGADLEAASAACDRGVELTAQAPRAYFSRGFLKFTRGDFAGAAEDFAMAAEKDDTNHTALYAEGVANLRLGRASEGDAMMGRARDSLSPFDIAYYAEAGLRP